MASAKLTVDVRKGSLKRRASLSAMLPTDSDLDDEGPIPPRVRPVEVPYAAALNLFLHVEERLEDVITFERDIARFECKVLMDLNPTCSWYKSGLLLERNPRIFITSQGGWQRLEIRPVKLSDHGLYTLECRYQSRYICVKAHLHVAPRPLNDGVFYEKTHYIGKGIDKQLKHTKVFQGETIYLEASFRFTLKKKYTWYRNNELLCPDTRMTVRNDGKTASLEITSAETMDGGIYYVVALTQYGYFSSFADVVVGDDTERRPILPIIEEYLPDEVEAYEGEEFRMVLKVHTDWDTTIKWYKNDKEMTADEYNALDYGNNYIGLLLPKPVKSSAGEYRVTLVNDGLGRATSAGTSLTVSLPPPRPREIEVVRNLESAVACCGVRVTFDCSFDINDPKYFYVVWHIGHYKIERSNTLFDVICGGGQFLLYIKCFEPSMAGEIVCELRRAYPNRTSVMINRTYANLVVVPPLMITHHLLEHHQGKIFYEDGFEIPSLNRDRWIRMANNEIDTQTLFDGQDEVGKPCTDYLMKLIFCKLDDDGLYFAYGRHGRDRKNNGRVTRVTLKERSDGYKLKTEVKWRILCIPSNKWFRIELKQTSGSFAKAGVTSTEAFDVEDVPIGRLMMFSVYSIEPLDRTMDSEICITPPPEVVLRLAIPHEIQPMTAFDESYTKTAYEIGSGAFGCVTLVRDNEDNEEYAAKLVKARVEKKRDHVLREFHIMKNLCHEKLIQLVAFFESRNSYMFVMEYLWGGELFDRVVGEEYLKEMDVVGYVKQIAAGLEYLHELGIVHLDLKPENIMCISPNSRLVKLIDFGVARNVIEETPRTIYGTKEYVAPEVIDYEPISTFSDMWSLGVVTYVLLSGVMPFAGENWLERSVNITRVNYDYEDPSFSEVSDLAKKFVDRLLIRRPESRLSARNVRDQIWIFEGPPKEVKTKRMNTMRQNLKSYLVQYRNRQRWQRAGNVMIAAHRLRVHAKIDPKSRRLSTDC